MRTPDPVLARCVALVLLGSLGCTGRGSTCARPDACGGRTVPGPCASPASGAPAHASRDRCLAAPFAPSPDEAPTIEGLVHTLGESATQHVLVREGTRSWTDEEIAAFRAAHERELFALGGFQGAGSGLACGATVEDHRTSPLFYVEMDLCAHRLDEIAAFLRARLETSVPAEASARVCVVLTGMTGPRCGRDDPGCAPIPYSGTLESARYACERDRTVFQWTIDRGLSRGACTHDGECVQAGCGNHCVAWPEGGFGATCEGYSDLESAPALCGCVAGSCAWFRL